MIKQVFHKKYIIFLLAFVFAKATVYLTPIFLAEKLSATDYGIMEYALAGLGMLVSTLFGLGVAGAYPYFILRKKNYKLRNAFILQPIWMLFLVLFNQLLFYMFHLYSLEYYMALNISYIIANQLFYSTRLKSHEFNTKAVLIDAGMYFVLLFGLLLGVIFGSVSVVLLNRVLQVYILFYTVYAIYTFAKVDKQNIVDNYKEILKFSVHLLISSFLLFLITVSGRMTVKEILGLEAVGVYGYYFRLAAVVVMIHQAVNIMFFKKIYTLDPRTIDKYYAGFMGFIYVISIGVFFVAPYILPYFFNYFTETYSTNVLLFFLLSAQMVLWIATALLSNIITRENLLVKNNLWLIGLSLFGLAFLFWFRKDFSLLGLSFLHYSLFFLAALSQIWSLYRVKIYFKKTALLLVSLFLITIIYLYMHL